MNTLSSPGFLDIFTEIQSCDKRQGRLTSINRNHKRVRKAVHNDVSTARFAVEFYLWRMALD